MNKTKTARNWLDMMGFFFCDDVIAEVITEATWVAKERNATRIGKNHLEIALERLADDAYQALTTEEQRANPRWVEPLTDDELPF